MKNILALMCLTVVCSAQAQTLTDIESVEYDPSQNRYFISNSSSIIQRAEDGTLDFFGNATASHGMEVMGDNLFAISNNLIKAYDLVTAEELMSLTIPGVGFLNGMANDGVSKIWVSDFSNDKIFEIDVSDLENPTYIEVVSDTERTPNGLVYDYLNDRLILVTWGTSAEIIEIDVETYELTTLLTTSVGNIDGIDMNMQGEFYISSWSPNRITRFNDDFTQEEILPILGLNAPADISFADATDTLAIPNSGNATVLFYSENPLGFENLIQMEEQYQLNVYPNPVRDLTRIEFVAPEPVEIKINLFDLNGRLVRMVCDGLFSAGRHAIQMDGTRLERGVYSLQMTLNGVTLKRQIVFE